MTAESVEYLTVDWGPWWSWGWDDRGEMAQMGMRLVCGHEIRATTRRSNEQLVRNYRRMRQRHESSERLKERAG